MKHNNVVKNEILINDNPKSLFNESINTIRTNLKFLNVDHDKKVILFTSPLPHDGKSFVTANLAVSFAKENKKVLIIDSDLRKGRQHRIFNMINDKETGYTNLILDSNKKDIKLSTYVKKTEIDNLYLLTTGAKPLSPTELLSSNKNRNVLNALKKHFDYIFIDCPPTLILSDALIMSEYSDINILVVSNKQTKLDQIKESNEIFNKANKKIDGVILNKVKAKEKSYYYYYED